MRPEEGEVAERKRRDDDDADDLQDDALFDDAVDDDAVDFDDEQDDVDDRPSRSGGTGTATKARPRAEGAKPRRETERVGVFGRIGRFVREVVGELRKVIWPTRKELLTYTVVVVVFVAVLMTIVALLDLGFARAVLWVFGGSK